VVASVARSLIAAKSDLDDPIGNFRTSRDTPERQASRVERSSKIRTDFRQAIHVVLRNLEDDSRISKKFLTQVRVTIALV